MLGHRASEYKTTEIYAHYAPDYLDNAATAIDSYFIDLQELVNRPLILEEPRNLRVSCVLANQLSLPQVPDFMERETRLELATPTLARLCYINGFK